MKAAILRAGGDLRFETVPDPTPGPNDAVVKVHWQFTTADARIKLRKLYPTIELQ